MRILLILEPILITSAFFVLYRNEAVFRYRNNFIKLVSEAATQDIRANRPWDWRFEELNKVSYGTMVLKFWKPLDSFYKDRSFVEPTVDGEVK